MAESFPFLHRGQCNNCLAYGNSCVTAWYALGSVHLEPVIQQPGCNLQEYQFVIEDSSGKNYTIQFLDLRDACRCLHDSFGDCGMEPRSDHAAVHAILQVQ